MSRAESVTSPAPPGAGRIKDMNYPDYTTAGTSAAALLNMRCRITGAASGGTLTNFSVLTGPSWQFSVNSCDSIQMVAGAAGGDGGSVSWLNQFNIHIRTSTGMPYWPLDDDWNVQRIVWVACINGSITTTNDMGLELLNQGAAAGGGIIRSPSNGFGFQYDVGGTNGTVKLLARNNASGQTQTLLATDGVGGFDIHKLHAFEMRIFSAVPGFDPVMKVLIDDVLITTMPFAGGAQKLPANGESGATGCGFFPTLICNSKNTAGMFTKYLSFQASTTELGCL